MAAISIIIPTLNEEKNIANILEDISKQSIKRNTVEVLVADAGSIDGTVHIAESYGAKIVSGGLPSIARNNGSKHANSDVLYFLDSDIRFGRFFF